MALSHVFLSPHLDDAVFSCGGTLWAARVHDESVRVVTVFAASPAADGLSPLAEELHRLWGARPHPYRARRGEDRRALAVLRVRGIHLSFPEAIYRRHGGGWLYPDQAALFSGQPRPEETDLVERIGRSLGAALAPLRPARLYVPLGIGGHVDHLLSRQAAEGLEGVERRYYEDFPYVARTDWKPPEGMRPDVVAVWPYVEPRLEAMAAYGSQLGGIFGDLERMRQEVRSYLERVGGERFWIPQGT